MDRDAFCNRRMLLSVGLAVILLGHTYLRNPDIAGIEFEGEIRNPAELRDMASNRFYGYFSAY